MIQALGWGIIGCGSLARNGLLPAAARSRYARVVACSSSTPEKARAFAAEFGIQRAHVNHEALVNDPAVQAVFVATPNHLHLAPVLAAAAAGKPVLCEKPLSMTLAEGEAMVAACEKTGVMLRLGLHLRFERFLDRVGTLVREGAVGEVRALSLERAAPMSERVAWREDPARGGSVLYDVGVHLLDLVPRLLGQRFVSVSGLASPPPGSGFGADTVSLLLRTEGDAQVAIRVSREASHAASDMTVLGRSGFLRTSALRWVPEYWLEVTGPDGVQRETAAPCDLYRDELDGFAEDLADGGTRLGTGADGLRLIRLAAACESALQEGGTVAIEG